MSSFSIFSGQVWSDVKKAAGKGGGGGQLPSAAEPGQSIPDYKGTVQQKIKKIPLKQATLFMICVLDTFITPSNFCYKELKMFKNVIGLSLYIIPELITTVEKNLGHNDLAIFLF